MALVQPVPNFGSGLFTITTVKAISLTRRSLLYDEDPPPQACSANCSVATSPAKIWEMLPTIRPNVTANLERRKSAYWVSAGPYTQCHAEKDFTICVEWDDTHSSWKPLAGVIVTQTILKTVATDNHPAVVRTILNTLTADGSVYPSDVDDPPAVVRTVHQTRTMNGPYSSTTTKKKKKKKKKKPTSAADAGSTRTRYTYTTISTTTRTTLKVSTGRSSSVYATPVGSTGTPRPSKSPTSGSHQSNATAFEGLWVSVFAYDISLRTGLTV